MRRALPLQGTKGHLPLRNNPTNGMILPAEMQKMATEMQKTPTEMQQCHFGVTVFC